jgi:cell division cycle 14
MLGHAAQDEELADHRIVLFSSDDPRRKANAALLLCLYVVSGTQVVLPSPSHTSAWQMIVQRRPPWEAFHPVAELELMPFRDAGRGPSDFHLSIQDCLWGMWKAMQNGLCDMNEFAVDEYEYYEKVENGDWNWITPGFLAFASPLDPAWVKAEKARRAAAAAEGVRVPGADGPAGGGSLARKLPTPFLNCLDVFEKRNVRLVVRLNTELYDRSTFTERGIEHVDLYFDDGTNPTDAITRTFIDLADEVISAGGAVAVHVRPAPAPFRPR